MWLTVQLSQIVNWVWLLLRSQKAAGGSKATAIPTSTTNATSATSHLVVVGEVL